MRCAVPKAKKAILPTRPVELTDEEFRTVTKLVERMCFGVSDGWNVTVQRDRRDELLAALGMHHESEV